MILRVFCTSNSSIAANMYLHMKIIHWISIPLSERQWHLLRNWLEILFKNGDIRRNKEQEEICNATKRNTRDEHKKMYSSDTDKSSVLVILFIYYKRRLHSKIQSIYLQPSEYVFFSYSAFVAWKISLLLKHLGRKANYLFFSVSCPSKQEIIGAGAHSLASCWWC